MTQDLRNEVASKLQSDTTCMYVYLYIYIYIYFRMRNDNKSYVGITHLFFLCIIFRILSRVSIDEESGLLET